ncbi:MAG: AbrB/MazE/SpoVT family DNA-binding domain-containing protein [Clostridia bacterium]|nr:AbrB/MazE/SpoVT family DNA-binding domain-containing protein [Clostridia bacterium]
MKATGIVRRIDDLGRIVIPIEIRRSMRIRDGDPLEIFVDRDGEVILKKYSAIADLGDLADAIVDSLHEATGETALLTDRDAVVAVAGGSEREYVGKPVGAVVARAMNERQVLMFSGRQHDHPGPLLGEGDQPCPFFSEVIAPVVVQGDPIGAVLLVTKEEHPFGPVERKLTETAAGFLARHMEE